MSRATWGGKGLSHSQFRGQKLERGRNLEAGTDAMEGEKRGRDAGPDGLKFNDHRVKMEGNRKIEIQQIQCRTGGTYRVGSKP